MQNFPTPEDINDSSDTAPSKRIQETIRGYKKVVDGPLLAMEVGLAGDSRRMSVGLAIVG